MGATHRRSDEPPSGPKGPSKNSGSSSMGLDAEKVAAFADRVLSLKGAVLSDSYYYNSLSLCVIDAVYSIGVQYAGVQNVVHHYCDHFGIKRFRPSRTTLPPRHTQESISELCAHFATIGVERMTDSVFRNKQRTSTRGGILKSEAVRRFAEALHAQHIEHLQDAPRGMLSAPLERQIQSIPGQRTGISLNYFWMLSGSDDFVKPDRMILGFLETATGRKVTVFEAPELVSQAAAALKNKHPHLTPRLLDHKMWEYQRKQ